MFCFRLRAFSNHPGLSVKLWGLARKTGGLSSNIACFMQRPPGFSKDPGSFEKSKREWFPLVHFLIVSKRKTQIPIQCNDPLHKTFCFERCAEQLPKETRFGKSLWHRLFRIRLKGKRSSITSKQVFSTETRRRCSGASDRQSRLLRRFELRRFGASPEKRKAGLC